MKVLFVLAVVIVAVSCEMCRDTSGCSYTMCTTGNEVHCINHQCTCTSSGGSGGCTMASDCAGSCQHGLNHHCIDGRCRCTHF
eukprot:XP_019920031.1 PREDICTED: serine protease inhibitor Cvsi-2-like [Crassostrea gigas]